MSQDGHSVPAVRPPETTSVAPVARRLVVGTYPPVPGPASAATLAAVRRGWASGREVVVASPRPSAAQEVVPVGGPAVGGAIAKLGRRLGCTELVVCLEPAWPFAPRPGTTGTRSADRVGRAVQAMAEAMSEFDRAELVVTGEIGLAPSLFCLLWPAVEKVWVSSADQLALLGALQAPDVELAVPAPVPYSLSGVGALEPGALLLVSRTRRQLGALSRAVLGSKAPVVRARLSRAARHLHKG